MLHLIEKWSILRRLIIRSANTIYVRAVVGARLRSLALQTSEKFLWESYLFMGSYRAWYIPPAQTLLSCRTAIRIYFYTWVQMFWQFYSCAHPGSSRWIIIMRIWLGYERSGKTLTLRVIMPKVSFRSLCESSEFYNRVTANPIACISVWKGWDVSKSQCWIM